MSALPAVQFPTDRPLGKWERLFYERVQRDHERLPDLGYVYDADMAERPVIFMEKFCRHYKGRQWAGKPLTLTPTQALRYREAFGWYGPDGLRRFNTMWNEEARKNGKSTGGAGLGLYLLVADGEPGADVYSSATKRDQARIIFDASKQMVRRSPALKRRVKIMAGNLHVPETASKYEPLSSDHNSLDGLNPHGNLVDEIHAHKNRGLWDVLETAMGQREQPMTAVFTTAGVYDPEGIGWELHDYACKVLEGVVEDESFMAYIASADEETPWDSDLALRQANPMLQFTNWKYLTTQRQKAIDRAGFRNSFERYHLNRWVNAKVVWLDSADWNACPPQYPSPWPLAGQPCWGALDLSSKVDLTAFVLAFQYRGGWLVLVRHYMPEEAVDAAQKRDRVDYRRWIEEGWITATPGNVVDYDFIIADVLRAAEQYSIQEVAYDPWNATSTANTLQDTHGIPMVEMRQGYASMSEPCKNFHALVKRHHLWHGGNPVLRWMANNAVVMEDPAENWKLDKKASNKRIDGIVASVMAVGRGMAATEDMGSIYAQGGLLVIRGVRDEEGDSEEQGEGSGGDEGRDD